MALPKNLVITRHGRSFGNAAIEASRKGDDRYFTKEFRARHSAYWRLVSEGCEQSRAAGKWIRENISNTFDGYFVSELIRALEAAAHLELPHARWQPKSQLIERNRGHLDIITRQERRDQYPKELTLKERLPYLWTPPGGESISEVRNRLHCFLGLLHREYDGKSVIIVTHGEIIDAFRMILEFLPFEEYNRIRRSQDPKDHTHNCQVLHYTRRTDPENPKDENLSPYLAWVRSIWPLDTTRSNNGWRQIVRPTFSNEALLAEVEKYPRIFPDE